VIPVGRAQFLATGIPDAGYSLRRMGENEDSENPPRRRQNLHLAAS